MHKILSQLLKSENKYPGNISVLKKIIITAWMGRLRINDLPPDKRFTLTDYLIDNERLIFDFSRVSSQQRTRFNHWLFSDADSHVISSNIELSANEHRGFTAEAIPGFWNWFKAWISGDTQGYWPLSEESFPVKGLTMQASKNGLLIGFDKTDFHEPKGKYQDPAEVAMERLGNSKRIYITDMLVDQLTSKNIEQLDLESICSHPHPHAIKINDYQKRYSDMSEYRALCQYQDKSTKRVIHQEVSFQPFCELPSGLSLFRDTQSGEILLKEAKPDLDIMVLCGGGSRIYAHVGVIQAFMDGNIAFTRFAGSSAGALVSVLRYLGYTASDLLSFFNILNKNNLIYLDVDREGLSSTQGLKSLMDLMILQKVDEIVKKYNLPYPEGLITFAVLEQLKRQCPDCGIGNDLLITATHIEKNETRYFSLYTTPDVSVSEAVVASSSFPVVFKPVLIAGEKYTDGGVLNNFPTAYRDNHSTFLELGQGNHPAILAVQFDNGTERQAVDNMMERVHKENIFLNLMYEWLTGVQNPASGWENDRQKLRAYALQSIVIDVGNINTTDFDLSQDARLYLFQSGYQAAQNYIHAHYRKTSEGYKNDEYIHARFADFEDLLAYCCYRNNKKVFDEIVEKIQYSALDDKESLLKKAQDLGAIYFQKTCIHKLEPGFFGHIPQKSVMCSQKINKQANHDYFRNIYALLLVLPETYLENQKSRKIFKKLHHSFTPESPLYGLGNEMAKITGRCHILFHIARVLIKNIHAGNAQKTFARLQELHVLLKKSSNFIFPECFHDWHLNQNAYFNIVHALSAGDRVSVKNMCREFQAIEKASCQKPAVSPDIPHALKGRVIL